MYFAGKPTQSCVLLGSPAQVFLKPGLPVGFIGSTVRHHHGDLWLQPWCVSSTADCVSSTAAVVCVSSTAAVACVSSTAAVV